MRNTRRKLPISILCFIVMIYYAEAMVDWSYDGSNGPSTWSKDYPKCGGMRQSPVDIQAKDSFFEAFKPINFVYDGKVAVTLENDGHTIKCSFAPGVNLGISGGGLSSKFRVAELHFHWGSNNSVGSEHKLNGKSFPLEMNILHYNEKYNGTEEAKADQNGLAVVSVMFMLSSDDVDNEHLNPITQTLSKLMYKGYSSNLSSLSLSSLLPSDTSKFYRYEGSLTKPSCDESVNWIVFKDVNSISARQLDRFRQIYKDAMQQTKKLNLVNNFRPIQPLRNRTVRRNFDRPYMFCGRKDNVSASCSKLMRGKIVHFAVHVTPCSLPARVFVSVSSPDISFKKSLTVQTSNEYIGRIGSLNYSLGVGMHSHGDGSLHVTVSQLDLSSKAARRVDVISETFPVDQMCSVRCQPKQYKDCKRLFIVGAETLEIGFSTGLKRQCKQPSCPLQVHVDLFRKQKQTWVMTGAHDFADQEIQQFDLNSVIVHSHKRGKRYLVRKRSSPPKTAFKAEIRKDAKMNAVNFKLFLIESEGLHYEVISSTLYQKKGRGNKGQGSGSKVAIGVAVVLILALLIGGVAYLLYRRRHHFYSHQPALVDDMTYDDTL